MSKMNLSTNNPAKLKQYILSLQDQFNTKESEYQNELENKKKEYKLELENKDQQIKLQKEKIDYLYERLRLEIHHRFGKKSEKLSEDQLYLFNEPLDLPEKEQRAIEDAEEEISVAAYARKKKGRKPFPSHFPREEIVHDLEEEEKVCDCCGNPLHEIGEDRSEQLDRIPPTHKVLVSVRKKYGCRKCEGQIKMASLPKRLIPKSMGTPGLLSDVLVAKYVDHLPFYRQEGIFRRTGIDLPRNTMCHWAYRCAEAMVPLINILKDQIVDGSYTNCDETPLRVLKENGNKKTSKSWMFVYCGGNRSFPSIVYDHQSTRSGKSAHDFLKEFKGYLQTDAFKGYNIFKSNSSVKLVGCWAHARRKYHDVVKITKTPGLAHEAMKYIRKLYQIEKYAREAKLSIEKRKELRQKKSKQILEYFKKWINKNINRAPPGSQIGQAMKYTLDNWTKLNRYTEEGLLEIDNNLVENAIRPFAVGRRNWLFNNNDKGAAASAVIYSLVMTCKVNEIDPYIYLKHIIEKLPYCENQEDYLKLTPQNYKLSL